MARGGFQRAVFGAAVVLVAALGGCHEPRYTKSVYATAVFDEAELDFGEVPVGEWREREVTVRNAGFVSFTIVEALKLDENPSYHVESKLELVPSGETRKVKVKFHPLKEGELTTRLQVNTDARFRPDAPLPVRGVGMPAPIIVEPRELKFETLEVDSDRTLEVSIQNPVDIPITVRLDGANVGEFSHDIFNIPPRTAVKLKAKFAPKTVGDRAAQLHVLACGDCTPARVTMDGRSVPSAFEFNPAPVPFQETPVHETTQSLTRLTNVTWRPVRISELITSDLAFATLVDLRDRTVQPGETVQLDMSFSARTAGPNMGKLDVNYLSDRTRKSEVGLDARGGRPQLAVTPIDLDFGNIPVGGKVKQTVRLTNAGTTGDLIFKGVAGSGAAEHFGVGQATKTSQIYPWSDGAWPQGLTAPDVPIAPGADYVDVDVFFQPTAAGAFEATLAVRSDDLFNPERFVTMKGTAYDPGPCTWRVLPWPALDFGNVPPQTGAILGFRFENAGTNICAVKDIHISNDGGGAFWMPGGALTGGVVLENDAFSAMIAFRSEAEGLFEGELSITVNDPNMPVIKLPLKAVAAKSCLVAAPHTLDFGPIRYDCAPQPRTTFVSNACMTPITVTGVEVGAGTSSQFAMTQGPATPLTLQPGDGFEVEVTYERNVLGQHYSPLYVHAVGEPTPFLVPMWAETNHEGKAVDRFVQGTANQLDVLFVVGNTTTMGPYQQKLKAAIPSWISSAQSQGLSMQVGVTTTGLVERSAQCGGGANGGEAGRLFPVDGTRQRILQGVAGRVADIQANLEVGQCHNLSQGLETMRMALSAPLIDRADDPRTPHPNDGNVGLTRDSARLAVVFLSDEDDHSGFAPDTYAQFLQGLKGPNQGHRIQAYAVIPDGSCTTAGPNGDRYEAVARTTGGTIESICAGSYSSILSKVLARAAGPQADFRLSFPVRTAGEIDVYVNGKKVPSTDWTYDADSNSIVFVSGAIPTSGQNIEVRYVSDCAVVPN